jgi:hypothetical protein
VKKKKDFSSSNKDGGSVEKTLEIEDDIRKPRGDGGAI